MKSTPESQELYLTAKPPACLIGTAAKARWKATIDTLTDEKRKLPRSNEGILVGYCAAFQLLADCEDSLQNHGLLVDGGRDGQKRSPALAGKLQSLAAIRSFSNELGLTPNSAKRLTLPQIAEDEINEFDTL